ncbi:GHMP family kinase ATP-binding protein [Martelella alba]|uniref:GHMP kinase n=1 Tax=Martelella alba TaxID=2590451 RepID=A0ABY2SPN0_9HYPH|nr:GHMP kinase [Martelella alba]TKI08062.1 GHMP kinase [Martelella alba]
MADARCPASCGELIQGWIAGGEKLVSCPIDWFSEVEIGEGSPAPDERPLSRRMLREVIRYFGYRDKDLPPLRIDCRSDIPIAKGLASSTADIAATAVAAARFLRQSLDETQLADLCLRLEPTDSTIFRALTLFDHRRGQCRVPYHWLPPLEILILESPAVLTTADFHRQVTEERLRRQAARLDHVWALFQSACRSASLRQLGQACTLSAIASDELLPKPAFSTLLRLMERHDLLGINVAHSGTVVGLLLDPRYHDAERLTAALGAEGILRSYPRQHRRRMVAGGVR